jgi:hypothetical protein
VELRDSTRAKMAELRLARNQGHPLGGQLQELLGLAAHRGLTDAPYFWAVKDGVRAVWRSDPNRAAAFDRILGVTCP